MGVVNVTPDSFFPGGRTPRRADAVAAGERQAAEGAALVDVGGQSTRPGAEPVEAEEECDRVVPVIEELARRLRVPISVDTWRAGVARAAVGAGAALVNDVSGGLLDREMPAAVAELGVPVIVGHLRGTPATMQIAPSYEDAPAEVRAELAERVECFVRAGVARDAVLVDPGIGFGKRPEDNFALLARLEDIASLGHPVVVGVSRKRFLGEAARRGGIADGGPEDRLEASLAAAALAVERGAVVLRVHDVLATRRALAAVEAILGEERP